MKSVAAAKGASCQRCSSESGVSELTANVSRPSEPAGVSSVEVEPDVALGQGSQDVLHALQTMLEVSFVQVAQPQDILCLLRIGTVGV